MTVPTLVRPLTAWRFLVEALRRLTEPRADVDECDRRVEALAAGSGLGRILASAVAVGHAAARDSRVARAWRVATASVSRCSTAERVRGAGCCITIAPVTVLVLRLATTERDPLTWVVPAAVAVVGALMWVGAGAIARAIRHYHARELPSRTAEIPTRSY